MVLGAARLGAMVYTTSPVLQTHLLVGRWPFCLVTPGKGPCLSLCLIRPSEVSWELAERVGCILKDMS